MRRTLALATCWLVLLGGVSQAQDGATSSGGTTFSPDGTIHVNIDLLVGGISGEVEPIDPEWQATADSLTQQIEDYWNQGLASHPAGDCGLTLKVDVDIDAVDFDSMHLAQRTDDYLAMATEPGRHTIGWSEGSGLSGGNAAWPEVYDPYDLNEDAGHDSTSPWQHDLDGYWSEHLEDARDFAHEVGHLMGLGDDYDDATQETAAGREGTLMGDGDLIDQALVNRLADVMRRAGIKLPECWTGTFEGSSSATYPEGGVCKDAWSMKFGFTVDAEGSVQGSGLAQRKADAVCPFPNPGAQWQEVDFRVLGTRTGDSLSLRFALEEYRPADGIEYAGFVAVFGLPALPDGGPPVELAVSGESAAGAGHWSFSSGNPPAVYATEGQLQAKCVASCAPAS
jgi:hypothetical protein